jgi:hypothetical protein
MLYSVPERIVKWNRNGYRCRIQMFLHDPMAASLTYRGETILLKNPAHLGPRKDPQFTQPEPRPA